MASTTTTSAVEAYRLHMEQGDSRDPDFETKAATLRHEALTERRMIVFRLGGANTKLTFDALIQLLEDLKPDSETGRRLRDRVMRDLQEGVYPEPYAGIFQKQTGLHAEHVRVRKA